MREILFRGKRKDKGKWVYGDYLSPTTLISDTLISCEEVLNEHGDIGDVCYKVIPETVGQCTGLTDKNGNKIFEGDIVNFKTIAYTFKKCVVKYDEQYARFACIDFNKAGFPMDISFVYEIIGNIHDNPELLEGTK